MYTLLNPCDQVEFPNTTLDLPGAKCHERKEKQNCERGHHRPEQRRVAATCRPAAVPTVAAPIAAGPIAAVLTAGALAAGVTISHRIGVRRRHDMLGMFCIDPGIIL